MPYFADENGNISFASEGVQRSDGADKIERPPEDAMVRGGDVRYEYDHASDEFRQIHVRGQSTYDKILDLFVQWEGSQKSALDRIDSVVTPSMLIAFQQSNDEILRTRLEQLQGSELTPSEVDQLIEIIT